MLVDLLSLQKIHETLDYVDKDMRMIMIKTCVYTWVIRFTYVRVFL